ncbi:hypothetical protein [Methanosarcina acetivorans]|nr:hypothetical protein [Methanosarcina acetivorans]
MKVLQTLSRLYISDLNSYLEFYEKLLSTPSPCVSKSHKSAWNWLK